MKKKLAKRLEALIKSAPERCTICHEEFEHYCHTFFGFAEGHQAAVTGKCCQDRIEVIMGGGIYLHFGKPQNQAEYTTALYSHPLAHLFPKKL